MKSWKTTVFGLMAAIGSGVIGAYAIKAEFLKDFPSWLPGLGVLFMSIGTACLGFAARDNDKSSEAVGASTIPKLPIVLLAAFLAVSLTGCNSTPQQVSYRTAGTTVVSVDHAMTAWGDYVAAKHPPADQEAKVKAAYERYQSAMASFAAANVLYVSLAGSGSTNATGAKISADAAQQQAATAFSDLLTLLGQFGITL